MTYYFRERLKLRQEMLKQQKLDSAASSDRASPVPAAVPVAASVAESTSSKASAGIAAAAATTPTASVAPVAAASSTASASVSPRKPPVVPTLSLPAKGETVAASTAKSADPAPTVNRRKSIDDILAAKTSNLDFSFDSDSGEESARNAGSTGKHSAPAAATSTAGKSTSAAVSKSYDDDVQEFDADEFD